VISIRLILTSKRDINYLGKFLIILATIDFNENHARDADKVNNPRYPKWALKLSRPSTVIVGEKGWDGFVMVIVKTL